MSRMTRSDSPADEAAACIREMTSSGAGREYIASNWPSSSTLSQLSATDAGISRAQADAPASASSSASVIMTPTGHEAGTDATASSTAATPQIGRAHA